VSITRYRRLYRRLVRFYPKPYRERFGEGMEQTFNDLLRERRAADKGIAGFVLWLFAETSSGIIKETVKAMTPRAKRNASLAIIFVGSMTVLFGVFLWNGADDAWLYLSSAAVVACSFWTAFQTKDKGQP
jgi:hypothetical protein